MKIPIVDENDNILCHLERNNKKPDQICRTADLWITDTSGNILLAQRSFRKKFFPGVWGSAVAGVIEEGETYEDGIIRETEEEIGLSGIKPIKGKKIKRYDCFNQQFFIVLPSGFNNFKLQEEEVAQIKWFTKEELLKAINEKPEMFFVSIKELI
jgi:isopentenyldiphosphate isomerase